MALEVVTLIDQATLQPDWVEKTEDALNIALGEIPVESEYNVMITVAERSYIIVSDTSKRLRVSRLMSSSSAAKALSTAQVRIVIDDSAFEGPLSDEKSEQLRTKRSLRVEGDVNRFYEVQQLLEPHYDALHRKVEACGPRRHEVELAVANHNAKIAEQRFEQKASESQMLLYTQETNELDLCYLPEDPVLTRRLRGWIMFSASTTMFGNVGQSNYAAANCVLDQLTFQSRMDMCGRDAITLMWGAVGNLGMRWKAFASQDQLLQIQDSDKELLQPVEAQEILRYLIMGAPIAPEWTTGWKTTFFLEYVKSPQWGWNAGNPWGFGKGGGISLQDGAGESYAKQASPYSVLKDEQHPGLNEDQPSRTEGVWLYPGRRVRVHGLASRPEFNETKGVLVEEVEPGKWQVRLDGGLGNKLLKVQNLKTLAGMRADADENDEKQATTTPHTRETPAAKDVESAPVAAAPVASFCLAGTFNDWTPQDMLWDQKETCFSLKVTIAGDTIPGGAFGICRGAAGKQWKVQQRSWTISGDGAYRIRLFLKDSGGIKSVDWVRL